MSSPHMFGFGHGHLDQTAADVAAQHEVSLVNYTDERCNCGHGCSPGTCELSARHWFECRDLGYPLVQRRAAAVMAALRSAGVEVL